MTSTMPAKARNNKTPMWQTLLAVAFWVAVWQGLAVCIGHNGLFLATPLQTVQTLWRLLPTADFWHRVGFSALRILTGFVLAVTVGLLLGACGARWRWFGTLVGPVMQLIRAMPVASFVILALLWVSGKNLSVIVSFTHVLPVVYAGVLAGILAALVLMALCGLLFHHRNKE